MTNTTELRKRYRKAFGYGLWEDVDNGMISRDHEVLAFIQQEIEAAEAAKENEIFAKLDALQEEHHIKAEAARGKDDSTFMHHNRIEGHLSYAKLRLREEIPNQT